MTAGTDGYEETLDGDDEQQIIQLYHHASQEVFKYAFTLPNMNHYQAQDLVQTAFEEAWRQRDRLRKSSLGQKKAWLKTVVVRREIDRWRATGTCDLVAEIPEQPSPARDPIHEVVHREVLRRCWEEMRVMPEVRQRVAFLRWALEWKTAEVADHLGITAATVRWHLKQARDRLVEAVGAEVSFLEEEADDGGFGPDAPRGRAT
jgi:RNA polymerase sigma factor (sigma-70 family)